MSAETLATLVWAVFVLGPIVVTVVLMAIEHVDSGE